MTRDSKLVRVVGTVYPQDADTERKSQRKGIVILPRQSVDVVTVCKVCHQNARPEKCVWGRWPQPGGYTIPGYAHTECAQ